LKENIKLFKKNKMNPDDQVVILAAFRTPIGSFNGSISSYKADELGSIVLKHIINFTKTLPDDVIIGQALTAGQGNKNQDKMF
jgi:acetyl-CoA C-acetyltransferase